MTSTERRSLSKEQYTVGWICALPKEMAAAKGMLDEIHRDLAQQDRMDHNNYLLGRVGKHNVVLASLPAGKSGLTPAATVAKDLSRTFPSIRFGLMVGIGGGVPSPSNDIRLGDIVVSQPTTTSGGVIQYDRGKTIAGGVSERTGTLNAPPNMLLTALSRLQAEHYTEGSKVSQYISTMLGDRPSMREAFSSPGASNDVLFKADSNHVDQATNCERCDHTQIIQRPIRDDEKPVMFYGNIASGDQVMKDGVTRDRLRTELDVLCFETEAAGLMWDYPCLVVRGICDYSDSHKKKIWQEYAAATAGAFAKELLSHITPEAVAQQKPIMQLVSDPTLHKAIAEQNRQQSLRYENDNHRECQRVFKTSTYENFKNNNPDRVPNTCRWVLEHTSFERWWQSPCDDLLWITADPGCGKSVLSKSLIDIELATSKVHTVCYFFFKDNDEQNDLATALCALLHQLFSSRPSLVRFAMTSYQENGENIQKESNELWRILVAAATAEEAHGVTCVLDALDECRSRDQEILINMLEDFYLRRATGSRRCQLKFLVTSRPYQAIERNFGGISHDFPSIRLTGEDKNAEISEEINLFIKHWVATKAPRLKMGQDARDALEERLLTTPNRTYLWLYLVLQDLFSSLKLTKKACLERIQTLPTTVEQAYERILNKHPLGRREEAEALLHIIVGSRRPLTLRKMDVALQLAVNAPTAQTHEDLDLDYENLSTRIRELCGLFVFIADSRVYLIHQTAKEFLVGGELARPALAGLWKHSLDKQCSEQILTEVCVRYLSLDDIDDQKLQMERESATITTSEYPFLRYSATHWSDHYRATSVCKEHVLHCIGYLYNARSARLKTWRSILLKAVYPHKRMGGSTAVHLAVLNGHADVVERLISEDQSRLNVADSYGRTALYWAATGGDARIVQILVDAGADMNAQGDRFGSALQASSFQGHEKIVQILVDAGADINAQGDRFGSALQASSFRGHEKIVQILVDAGADMNAQGDRFESALQAALCNGREKIVQILLNAGAEVKPEDEHARGQNLGE